MMKIGDRQFDVENDCYVMGILNVTPDSFSVVSTKSLLMSSNKEIPETP